MASYRIYSFDGPGISQGEGFEAATDHEAVSKARQMKPEAIKCEIWEGRRLVASFEGRTEPA